MSITRIRLDDQTQDQTLTPAKVSTNPSDNFAFPGRVDVNTVKGRTGDLVLQPFANSTSGVKILNAAGSSTILQVDTTNGRISLNGATPTAALSVNGSIDQVFDLTAVNIVKTPFLRNNPAIQNFLEIQPTADGTRAVRISNAGSSVRLMSFDTTNSRIIVNENGAQAPQATFEVLGQTQLDSDVTITDRVSVGTGGNLSLTAATPANGGSIVLTGTGSNGTPGLPGKGNIYANNVNAPVVITSNLVTNLVTGNVGAVSFRPQANSVAALKLQNATGSTTVLDIDTTNSRVGINNVAPTQSLDVTGAALVSTKILTPEIRNTSDVLLIDVTNKLLKDASSVNSTDWGTRVLKDSSDVASLNWATRTLKDTAGASILDWSGPSINAVTHKIINIVDGSTAQEAVSFLQLGNGLGLKVSKAGDSMTGALAMGNNQITGLAAGTSATDAVNKAQLDAASSGLIWLNPILDPDMIEDRSTIPGSPIQGVVYLATATTGAWTIDHVYYYNGASWVDALGRAVMMGDRFGVSLENGSGSEAGSFSGKHNQIAEITGGSSGAWTFTFTVPVDQNAVFDNNDQSEHFGHSYTYSFATTAWIEFSGPAATPAGIGLYYTGSTLNVALGAGIIELPTDEVGVDVHTAGGLFTTVDNSTPSTVTGAQLAVKIDGTTLSKSSSGLRVAALGITNGEVATSAAIAYGKLNLALSIVNGDIAAGAAIAYSKLALSNSIVNADVNSSAAIAYSKLALSNSIVNADVSSSAAIAYSKLALSNSIVNADINASAAIAYTKLTAAGSDRDIQFNNSGVPGSSSKLKYTQGANNTVIIGYGNANALQLYSNNSGGDGYLDAGNVGFNLVTAGGTWSFDNNSLLTTPGNILVVGTPSLDSAITIKDGGNGAMELFFTNSSNAQTGYIGSSPAGQTIVSGEDQVMIESNVTGKQWFFDNAGKLTTPGQIDMASHKIVNVTDPTSNQDAATKAYVDGFINAHTVTREVPSGAINGTNDTFTLAFTPVAGSETVFLNGLLQNEGSGNDYTIAGDTIVFEPAAIPETGSVLLVCYRK
jgi:hypothetical protein